MSLTIATTPDLNATKDTVEIDAVSTSAVEAGLIRVDEAMAAIDSVDEAVFFVQLPSLRIVRANRGAALLLQSNADRLVSTPLSDVLAMRSGRIADITSMEVDFTAWLLRNRTRVPVRVRCCRPSSKNGFLILACRDVRPQRTLRRLASHPAHQDSLTRLPNRTICRAEIDFLLSDSSMRFAVCYIDLDDFKQVNDQRGHHTGDLVLTCVARRLAAQRSDNDLLARYGGDEFVAVLRSPQSHAEAIGIARKMRQSIRRPIMFKGGTLSVTATIGICWHEGGKATADYLLNVADRALYRAKRTRALRLPHRPRTKMP